ncbi:MAG: methyl-accepting chemotaxis protein [Negativicutes bacterium]|nr:methyl-accepting chemotaxis protein [Negativicutes bacterium]
MVEKINLLLTNINTASNNVLADSRRAYDSNMALLHGTSEQGAPTASIVGISSLISNNTCNADQANKLASAAKEKAVQGDNQIKEMVIAMEEINDTSTNISKVIKVIEDIAFQTNILALNAAVEAARAGQHGKGFAVVAEEVRNLATRSADAAKETAEMIHDTISKVDGGTKIAKNATDALNKIVSEVSAVAALMNDIAVSSKKIDQGIMLISQEMQSNSAINEELANQAELMKKQVGSFKLKNTDY